MEREREKIPKVSARNYVKSNWEKEPNKRSEDRLKFFVKDILKQIYFQINLKGLSEQQIAEIQEIADAYAKKSKESPLFLAVGDIIRYTGEPKVDQLIIICQVPNKQTISQYHNENQCFEVEINYNAISMKELYLAVAPMGYNVDLSVDDMSLVHYKRMDYPFPTILITPYAFMKAYFRKMEGDQDVHLHKSFGQIFEYIQTFLEDFHDGKKVINTIVTELLADKDATEIVAKDEFIKQADLADDIPELVFDDYNLEKILGLGSFGAVMKAVHKETGKVYALKQSGTEKSNHLTLYKEGYIMNLLDNPNVIKSYGFTFSKVCAFDLVADKGKKAAKLEDKRNKNPEDVYGYLLIEFCSGGDVYGYIKKYLDKEEVIPIETLKVITGQLLSLV